MVRVDPVPMSIVPPLLFPVSCTDATVVLLLTESWALDEMNTSEPTPSEPPVPTITFPAVIRVSPV